MFSLFGLFGKSTSPDNNITCDEFSKKLKTNSVLVLDVRTAAECTGPYKKIASAINIPLQELSTRIKELEKFKNREIAVICQSGARSRSAAKFLSKNGFNVHNVLGGMSAFKNR
jgi:rhodanese-related sulfurtransferase